MFGLSNSNEKVLSKWRRATNYEDKSLDILLQVIEKVISKHQELKLVSKETNFIKNAYFVSLLLGRFHIDALLCYNWLLLIFRYVSSVDLIVSLCKNMTD